MGCCCALGDSSSLDPTPLRRKAGAEVDRRVDVAVEKDTEEVRGVRVLMARWVL